MLSLIQYDEKGCLISESCCLVDGTCPVSFQVQTPIGLRFQGDCSRVLPGLVDKLNLESIEELGFAGTPATTVRAVLSQPTPTFSRVKRVQIGAASSWVFEAWFWKWLDRLEMLEYVLWLDGTGWKLCPKHIQPLPRSTPESWSSPTSRQLAAAVLSRCKLVRLSESVVRAFCFSETIDFWWRHISMFQNLLACPQDLSMPSLAVQRLARHVKRSRRFALDLRRSVDRDVFASMATTDNTTSLLQELCFAGFESPQRSHWPLAAQVSPTLRTIHVWNWNTAVCAWIAQSKRSCPELQVTWGKENPTEEHLAILSFRPSLPFPHHS